MLLIKALWLFPLAVFSAFTLRPCLDAIQRMLPLSHQEIGALIYHICCTGESSKAIPMEQLVSSVFELKIVPAHELFLRCCSSDSYIGILDFMLKTGVVTGSEESNRPIRLASMMGCVGVTKRLLQEPMVNPTEAFEAAGLDAIDSAMISHHYKVLDVLLQSEKAIGKDLVERLVDVSSDFQCEFALYFGKLKESRRYPSLMREFETGTTAWSGFIATFLRVLREPSLSLTRELEENVPFELIPHLNGLRAVKQDDARKFLKWFESNRVFLYSEIILDWTFSKVLSTPSRGVWRALTFIASEKERDSDKRVSLLCNAYRFHRHSRQHLISDIQSLIFQRILDLLLL